MKEMSEEKLSQFKKQIDQALDAGAEPIAAFDADDMGEHFFHHQINEKLLPNLPPNPWDFYWDLHERDTPAAFLWLAQINAGLPLSQVRAWAEDSCRALDNIPFFSGVRAVIDHLHKRDVKIYIVTASIKWAVEPGAKRLGIPFENVVGVTTKIVNDKVTTDLDGVVTWREGKVTGLLRSTAKKHPFLAAGNTMGDLALLESATHLSLVNAAVDQEHVNFETERKLVEIAQKRDWFYHLYRAL
jgi:phosphoserine phosphatase